MLEIVTVHTTGVNLDSVLANAVALTIIIGFFAAIIVRLVKRSIQDAVNDAMQPIVKRIDDHDTRIAHLEGVEQGKAYAIAAAGVSANPGPLRTDHDSESTTTTTSRTKRRRK
jgi:hypothetical protein